jgi:hypothetical protein
VCVCVYIYMIRGFQEDAISTFCRGVLTVPIRSECSRYNLLECVHDRVVGHITMVELGLV